jgi:hypothetical protein
MRRSILNLVMVCWFLAELCPFYFEKKKEIFSFCSLSPKKLYTFNSNLRYVHFIEMCRSSLNLVMVLWFLREFSLLNFKKKKEIFSFYSLSSQQSLMYTFNSNLIYGYFKEMCMSISNLVIVQWFLAELCPFNFKKKKKWSVSVHYLPN